MAMQSKKTADSKMTLLAVGAVARVFQFVCMCEAEDAIIVATAIVVSVSYIQRQKLSFGNWIKLNAVEIVFPFRSVRFVRRK